MITARSVAAAKINWYLELLGRREDGFHELETVFQTIDLHDDVSVCHRPGQQLELRCSQPGLPTGPDNLAWRAATAWCAHHGIASDLLVILDKRIPAAGGLAGGSSDAAAVLRCLQALAPRLAVAPLSPTKLVAIATELGSDVPFFLVGGTAHARGRGEELTPLPDPTQRTIELYAPSTGIATPQAFAALTEAERGPRRPRGAAELGALLADDPSAIMHNRLEAVAMRLEADVSRLLDHLRGNEARALLCGSGSTCFSLDPIPAPSGVQHWSCQILDRASSLAVELTDS